MEVDCTAAARIHALGVSHVLVKGGYLLAEDVAPVVKRASEHWEYAHEAKN